MSRVIAFSRYFPSYHPRRTEPTYFVEKILIGLIDLGIVSTSKATEICNKIDSPIVNSINDIRKLDLQPKYHTIRRGNRWKAGDKFSPRVWSGKPYCSKQIIIAPDIEVKKTFGFKMDLNGIFSIDGFYIEDYERLALNDGLTSDDMFCWLMPSYNKPVEFTGQIISWNEEIKY